MSAAAFSCDDIPCLSFFSGSASAITPTEDDYHNNHNALMMISQQQQERKNSYLRRLSESDGDDDKGTIDLIDLTDFDVQVALTQDSGVQLYEVLKIMTEFLNEEFASCFASEGTFATFDTVILLERARRLQMEALERQLDTSDPNDNGEVVVGELFTASFKGAALFTRLDEQKPLPPSIVEGCQRQAFLEEDALLDKLQQSGGAGLGLAVVDVRAFINPNASTKKSSTTESGSDSLEVVIIIAIVIACVAFLFLVFAIYWAWRYDKKNRDAYLTAATAAKTPESQRTFDANNSPESKEDKPKRKSTTNKAAPAQPPAPGASVTPSYPSVIGGDSVVDGVYPESVISEDINSSLTQYYQSGLQNYTANNGRLQDAGSVSSMESYGYSLDAFSTTTPLPADANTISNSTKDGAGSSVAASSKKSQPTPVRQDP